MFGNTVGKNVALRLHLIK